MLAQESDFLPAHADALADLAEVLRLAGREDEARAALEEAIVLYEQKGNLLAIGASARLARQTGGGLTRTELRRLVARWRRRHALSQNTAAVTRNSRT